MKIAWLGPTATVPQANAGKIKLLAQTSAKRAPYLSSVPTLEESGFKGMVLEAWYAAFVPKGTPPAIVAKLNAEMQKAVTDPAMQESFTRGSMEAVGGTPEALLKVAQDELGEVRAAGEGAWHQAGELMPDASDGMIASLGPASSGPRFFAPGRQHAASSCRCGRQVCNREARRRRPRTHGRRPRKPPTAVSSQTGRNPAISPGRGRNRATQRWANKENTLANPAKTAVADAQFKKTQREQDGKKAMAEYEANGLAMRAKTAKLRELRLARDAEEAAAEAANPVVKKPAKKAAKTKPTISAYHRDQEGSRNR